MSEEEPSDIEELSPIDQMRDSAEMRVFKLLRGSKGCDQGSKGLADQQSVQI